jgi:acetylornithine/succinyldiaminopimelate/putrescine aminotransferase
MSERKEKAFELARKHVIPGKVDLMTAVGIDMVIGEREGPYLYDIDGRQLIDCHVNGGTYNLGHRNPELVRVLKKSLDRLDIGNHHFTSEARNALAVKLAECTPEGMDYTVFAASGSEAIDVAVKSARHATQRRKIVGLEQGYHGRTGISGAIGDDDSARFFLSEGQEGEFIRVPFNDLDAMEAALQHDDVAAVVLETIPATMGFPIPDDGYLPRVRELCANHGTLYVADEVQTGLGRCGTMWGVEAFGVEPDILVTGKGLSGGLYPIAATVLHHRCAWWLKENGFAHVSTFGGAEVGCPVAERVLEICSDPAVLANVNAQAAQLRDGLETLREKHPETFLEIRQQGLVMGLKFAGSDGAIRMMKALYDSGIWAIFAGYDPSVLQFKPIILIDDALRGEILDRFEKALNAVSG